MPKIKIAVLVGSNRRESINRKLARAPGPMAKTRGAESRRQLREHRPARLGQQSRLRQVLGILGVFVMAGEAYISFKPGLVDSNGRITDKNTRQFLQAFVDRFGRCWSGCSSPARQPPRLEVRPPRLRLQQARHKRG